MKKLKANQLGPWCGYCAEKTVRATHRPDGFYSHIAMACEDHKFLIKGMEEEAERREGRMTEADHQTWGRL